MRFIDKEEKIYTKNALSQVMRNDQADKAARSSLNITTEKSFKIPYKDFRMKVDEYILQQSRQRWNSDKHKKLLEIKSTLEEWKQGYRKKKNEKKSSCPDVV